MYNLSNNSGMNFLKSYQINCHETVRTGTASVQTEDIQDNAWVNLDI